MTNTLIDNLNLYVEPDDILFHLGDFCFKDHRKIPELRSRINCKTIHTLRGNHDHHIDKYKDSFTSISDYLEVNYDGNHFILSHYPILSWNGMHKPGYFHAFGHVHGSLKVNNGGLDVGMDNAFKEKSEYAPFELNEVITWGLMFKDELTQVCHHDSNSNVK